MLYHGQRVQVDVSVVPLAWIISDSEGLQEHFFQYTAIDEYSRFRFLAAFMNCFSYSAAQFVQMLVKRLLFRIECIQTDNGPQFTNRFTADKNNPPMFQLILKLLGITHKLMKPYTPRHNGKVERSHRKDNEYFYAKHNFISFEDFKAQLGAEKREYIPFPCAP